MATEGRAKPNDWPEFMKVYAAYDKVQEALVRGHLPKDTRIALEETENLLLGAINIMKGG